jgi:hypothetical protein
MPAQSRWDEAKIKRKDKLDKICKKQTNESES